MHIVVNPMMLFRSAHAPTGGTPHAGSRAGPHAALLPPPHAAGASLLHIYLNNVASEISATSLDAGNRTIQIR